MRKKFYAASVISTLIQCGFQILIVLFYNTALIDAKAFAIFTLANALMLLVLNVCFWLVFNTRYEQRYVFMFDGVGYWYCVPVSLIERFRKLTNLTYGYESLVSEFQKYKLPENLDRYSFTDPNEIQS